MQKIAKRNHLSMSRDQGQIDLDTLDVAIGIEDIKLPNRVDDKSGNNYLESCVTDMKIPVFGYPLMNFKHLTMSQIPQEFQVQRNLPTQMSQDEEDFRNMPGFERNWRVMSRTVISRNMQEGGVSQMVDNYIKQDKKLVEKIREFTYGGRARMHEHQILNESSLNASINNRAGGNGKRNQQGQRNFRSLISRNNIMAAAPTSQQNPNSTITSQVRYAEDRKVKFTQKRSGHGSVIYPQKKIGDLNKSLLNSSGCQTTLEGKNSTRGNGINEIKQSRPKSTSTGEKKSKNNQQAQLEQLQCIGKIDNFNELEMTDDGPQNRPDLLEQWLISKEGRDFVIKNKLYHLKRDPPPPEHKSKSRQSNSPVVQQSKKIKAERYKQENQKQMQSTFIKEVSKDEQDIDKTPSPKARNSFLKGRLLMEDKFQRSLRKHLNVISNSNAFQANVFAQDPLLKDQQMNNTLIKSEYIPERYKSLLNRGSKEKKKRLEESLDKISELRKSQNGSQLHYRNDSSSPVKPYLTQTCLIKPYNRAPMVTRSKLNKGISRNQILNQNSRESIGVSQVYLDSDKLYFTSEAEIKMKDVEPEMPKLDFEKLSKNGTISNQGSLENLMMRTSVARTRPLSPILEDAKKENRKPNAKDDEDDDEPDIPLTGYEYDKYKTEASIFLQGSINAKKLYKISEQVKISKEYKVILKQKKKDKLNSTITMNLFDEI